MQKSKCIKLVYFYQKVKQAPKFGELQQKDIDKLLFSIRCNIQTKNYYTPFDGANVATNKEYLVLECVYSKLINEELTLKIDNERYSITSIQNINLSNRLMSIKAQKHSNNFDYDRDKN